MKSNNSEPVGQLALQTSELPSLRIAYKNTEAVKTRPVALHKKSKATKTPKKVTKETKEPLPLFNDYKFKAKDHDPL